MICLFVNILLSSSSVRAAHIENVQILDLETNTPNYFTFKVRSRTYGMDSFFFLEFNQGNAKDMDKMAVLLRKLVKVNDVRLD